MHYADGQPAKVGDLIIHDDFGSQVAGILTGANAQSDTCNGTIHAVAKRAKSQLGLGNWLPLVGSNDNYYVTLSKSVAVDFGSLAEFTPGPAAPASPVPPHVPATAEPAHVEASAAEVHAADPNAPTSKVVEIAPSSQVNQDIAQPEPAPPSPCPAGYEIAGGATQQQS